MLCFRKFPMTKKFMDKRGGIKIFRRKIFVLQVQKILWGTPSVFPQFRLSELFMLQRVVTIFCRKFFVS